MTGMNTVYLLGTIGQDPEPRSTSTGVTVVKLRIATPHVRKVSNVWTETTDWHTVTLFGSTAQYVANYARKGCIISVVAALRPSKWNDKEGRTHYEINIVVDKVVYLSKPRDPVGGLGTRQGTDDSPPPHEDSDAPPMPPEAEPEPDLTQADQNLVGDM